MNTLHLSASPADIARAAELIRAGETVAMPTETVYGLAADALSPRAVAKIFEAKGRPQDNPLIVHIAGRPALFAVCRTVPDTALRLADAFWPGPLTVILPRAETVPPIVSAGLGTVAVRCPSHPAARALITAAGVPLAAPSANLSGSPSPTTAARVFADLEGRIAAVIDGGPCEVGVESTVVDLCASPPRLLRPGGVTADALRGLLGEIAIDQAVTAPLQDGRIAPSPGMKYRHYAPRASVVLVRGDADAFARAVNAAAGNGVMALGFDGETEDLAVPALTYGARGDHETQARRVFEALREADDLGARTLYVACPDSDGVGLAVYNRLLRAAAFRVIEAGNGQGDTGNPA